MKLDFVVAGYIFHGDKVLLIHHRKLDLWLPVGGHIEKDETPDDALIREVLEETGLEIEFLQRTISSMEGNVKRNLAMPFHANIHDVGDHDHCCFFYACRALNAKGLKINGEIKDYGWYSKNDLHQSHIPADVRNIAEKAFEIAFSLDNPRARPD